MSRAPGSLNALGERAVDLARAHGADEVKVAIVEREHALTRFANSVIHQNVAERTTSIHLTVVRGGRVATVSSTSGAPDDGRATGDLVERAMSAAALVPVDRDWPGLAPPGARGGSPHFDEATAACTPDDRARLVDEFCAAGAGLRGAGYAATEVTRIMLVNSGGLTLRGASTQATIDGIHQTDGSAGKGHQTSVGIGDLDAHAAGARAADLARRSLGATDVEPGRYPVVLSPEAVATVCTYLSFYGFNAKMIEDGQSFYEAGAGQFDPALTLREDVSDTRALGTTFDADGTETQTMALIDGGRTGPMAHDRRTAARAGVSSTGHAIPGGETWGPFAGHLFVVPSGPGADPRPPTQLVAGLDHGLLVTELNYNRVLDPKTLVVTGLTRNGTFLVKGGEIVRPVTGLRYTQSFVDAFGPDRIGAIGDDARFADDGEFGVGLVFTPSMRLADWNFTGGAKG